MLSFDVKHFLQVLNYVLTYIKKRILEAGGDRPIAPSLDPRLLWTHQPTTQTAIILR